MVSLSDLRLMPARDGGRDISTDLQQHWQRLLVGRFGRAAYVAGGGSCRMQYDAKLREHEEKGRRICNKIQLMFQQDRESKQLPGRALSQAFLMGLHEKTVSITAAKV